jgi:hypothetical protein
MVSGHRRKFSSNGGADAEGSSSTAVATTAANKTREESESRVDESADWSGFAE